MDAIFMFSVIIAGFIAFATWGSKLNKKRQAELAAWAQNRGWEYAREDRSLVQRWPVAPFSLGRRNRPSAKNVLWGPTTSPQGQVRQALSFTYQYEVRSGSGEDSPSTTYPHHVTCVFLGQTTPVLEMSPENFSAKISKALGGQDIQFESEAFNKRWRVEAQNLKFAHAIINPQMMEHLMHPQFGGLSFAFAGDCVLVFNNRPLDVVAVDPMLAICHDFIDRIPSYVLEDFS